MKTVRLYFIFCSRKNLYISNYDKHLWYKHLIKLYIKTWCEIICWFMWFLHGFSIQNSGCWFFQALPIFLDSLVTAWGAILISVTLILLFGEVRNFSPLHILFQVKYMYIMSSDFPLHGVPCLINFPRIPSLRSRWMIVLCFNLSKIGFRHAISLCNTC
jgi:hypothetical protein